MNIGFCPKSGWGWWVIGKTKLFIKLKYVLHVMGEGGWLGVLVRNSICKKRVFDIREHFLHFKMKHSITYKTNPYPKISISCLYTTLWGGGSLDFIWLYHRFHWSRRCCSHAASFCFIKYLNSFKSSFISDTCEKKHENEDNVENNEDIKSLEGYS